MNIFIDAPDEFTWDPCITDITIILICIMIHYNKIDFWIWELKHFFSK